MRGGGYQELIHKIDLVSMGLIEGRVIPENCCIALKTRLIFILKIMVNQVF